MLWTNNSMLLLYLLYLPYMEQIPITTKEVNNSARNIRYAKIILAILILILVCFISFVIYQNGKSVYVQFL